MPQWFPRPLAALQLALLLSTAPAWAGEAPRFIPLGDIGNAARSEGRSISGDGRTVVGVASSPEGEQVDEAFRWTEGGGMQGLGSLSQFLIVSVGAGVSHDGAVVVGSTLSDVSSNLEAFRWTEAGGMIGLGFLHEAPMFSPDSQGFAVSADGSIVVGKSKPDPLEVGQSPGEAFRWTEKLGLERLGDLPGGIYNSRGTSISADGRVIAGFSLGSNGSQTFIWTRQSGMVGGGDLPGGPIFSEATGISANGLWVVGFSTSAASVGDPAPCGVLWPDNSDPGFVCSAGERIGAAIENTEPFRESTLGAGIAGLGFLPGGCSSGVAYDTTADGSVVVGFSNTDVDDEAFIWDSKNGMRNLRTMLVDDHGLGDALEGWVLHVARGISDDGLAIAGTGTNPAGQCEAFVVTWLPEPSSAALSAAVLFSLAGLARVRGGGQPAESAATSSNAC